MPAKSLAADKKVDCDKILTEIETGKSAQNIAKTMGISTSTVYRCEKKATTSIPSASSSQIATPTHRSRIRINAHAIACAHAVRAGTPSLHSAIPV
jgi:transcriptional regulator